MIDKAASIDIDQSLQGELMALGFKLDPGNQNLFGFVYRGIG
jgi:hypothetical protein